MEIKRHLLPYLIIASHLTIVAQTTPSIHDDEKSTNLEEVVINHSGISRLKRQPYNAIAIDTKSLKSSSKSLSDALNKAPGVKLRENGGIGSDMQILLDGYSGRHVKIFIDGVPQEGIGSSFGLNNLPISFAERIEVYKGVVPINFGTDAIGGVINIVSNKFRKPFWVEASYSVGSFNTHRTNVNLGQNFKSGIRWELTAFQNFSDNNYSIYAPVEDFETGRIDRSKLEKVKRFHDTFHNEAAIAQIGIYEKSWADKLNFKASYSQNHKNIQTGVRQDIVYGDKARKSYSLITGIEYIKRNFIINKLDLTSNINYNHNITTNIDTSEYRYNWYGEKVKSNTPGEQSLQHTKSFNNNWNNTINLNYRFAGIHVLTINNIINDYYRHNTSLLAKDEAKEFINKRTLKNILGIQYRVFPTEKYNLVAFGKWYHQYVSGPIAEDVNSTKFVKHSHSSDSWGYGMAATYFPVDRLQAKFSYEKAVRLPTLEESFGDEDLEIGNIAIKPESSHNINFNLHYTLNHQKHTLSLEGAYILRFTNDYIQRNIVDLSGGKQAASYINYGKVFTKGWNISARYNYSNWLSLGGNFTRSDVRDNMKTILGSSMPNISYRERMPNLPYCFADGDISITWHNCLKRGSSLRFEYETMYLHNYTFYPNHLGSNNSDYLVPSQFSHNIMLTYSMKREKYRLSFECRNLTDEQLYDNFRLQKPGRAFYGKFLIII